MATPTCNFRHVVRTVNLGDGDIQFIGLQQWFAAEGWEREDFVRNKGWWEDVPVSRTSDMEDYGP